MSEVKVDNLRKRQGKWTPRQWEGITTAGRSLLVSAAAGSGKTAVLAERCAHLVCDAEEPCDVDELLVVTFTESAAAEMRSRIQQAVTQRVTGRRAGGGDEKDRLTRQLALVEHAQVSTVHGFCSRVLRQNFNLLGLDPNFQILDGDEADLLRSEVARDLFHRRYELDESGDFQRLIDSYGEGDDERLIRQVVRTHELLCSLVDPDGWIERTRSRIAEASKGQLESSALGKELVGEISTTLSRLSAKTADAIRTLISMRGFDKYVEQLREIQACVQHWQGVLKSDGIDGLNGELADFELPRAPTIRGEIAGKEIAKALLDSVKGQITAGPLTEFLILSGTQWQEGLQSILPHAEEFLDLVAEFAGHYREAKDTARGLDFSDLERLALQVLRDPDSSELKPSVVARGYHRQYRHVLVDEYQDINEIQDAILTLVSRECVAHERRMKANLFCVGDVKQSIFRFRLAEPARFLDRQSRFRKSDANKVGQVIDLRENFRSRAPLLEAINRVFERVMTGEAAEIEYDDSHRLVAGATYPPEDGVRCFRGAPIELHLLPDNLSGSQGEEESEETPGADPDLERADYEATLLAHRIREITGMDGSSPTQICERDGAGEAKLRPARFGDIVILLRSLKFKADRFADVLRRHGIPVHSEGGTGFFQSEEIRDVLALLSVLDNQQQDIALAAVLRSPLAAIPKPDDALARIRLAYPIIKGTESLPFHQAVVRYAEEQGDELAARLRDFLRQLADWRDDARKRPVAEVLWEIYDRTGYLAYCEGLEDGSQRVANLIYLHERARQFGTFLRQGLYRFMRFIDGLRLEKDLGRPSVASEAEQVVRIMSVHRSKGLEFPIVLLPDLGKRINLEDTRGAILVDRCAGLGMSVVDEARRIRYPSLASVLVKRALLRQTLAEELRLLYVAMTRAREHLILVGTCRENACEKWAGAWRGRAGPLPADEFLGARTVLDWIGPVSAMTAGTSPPVFDVRQHTIDEILAWPNPKDLRGKFSPRQEAMAALRPLEPAPPPNPTAETLIERFSAGYRHQPFIDVPAALAATAVAKGNSFAARSGAELSLPAFYVTDRAPSGADVGQSTHLLLEHLDFRRTCDADDVASQIEELLAKKILTPPDAARIDRAAIHWMMSGEVGRLLRGSADQVRREVPFALTVPAQRIGEVPASADPLDQVMIRGRIDVLVPDGDGIAVVDYKTDRIEPEQIAARAEQYGEQMALYREAVGKIAGRPVSAVYLVFLAPRVIWTPALTPSGETTRNKGL